jgi:hypothetical protein
MKPFGRLEETGLSVMELCALYFSRTLLDTLPGTPLADEAERAFAKIERALPSRLFGRRIRLRCITWELWPPPATCLQSPNAV